MTGGPNADGRRHGRWELFALTLAVVFGALLVAAALYAPAYQSTTVSSSGAPVRHTASLVEENGSWAMVVAGVPLLIALVVSGAIWSRGDRPGAGPFAWSLVGLLIAFNLVAMLSIGPFVIPVTACLVVACILHGARTPIGRSA